MTSGGKWHVEKGIPLALIVTIMVQTCGIVWWASNLSMRVEILERGQSTSAAQSERTVRLEEKVNNLQIGLLEIKELLKERPATRR